MLLALAFVSAVAQAQPQPPRVEVVVPALEDTLASATPRFVVVARDVVAPPASVSVGIQVSRTSTFEPSAVVYDETAPGDSAELVPDRPLPSATTVYWRGVARIDGAIVATSGTTGPRLTVTWLTLLAPDAPAGVVVETRRPTFTWRSAPVATPPGPWRYDLTITSVNTGERLEARGLTATDYTPVRELEANTSYRWSVLAYLATGDSIRRESAGSFVVNSPDRPRATLLYQNFPNPFPSPRSATTCVWFDIASPVPVRIDILTLRGERVRTLFPAARDDAVLGPGRYGRGDDGSNSGCDPRFAWDGRSDAGIAVHAGVYVLRLQAGSRAETRRIVFRGS